VLRWLFCRIVSHFDYRPVNKEELFNLRHASARNVIERIFGILKRRFRILLIAPEYSLEIQARIPAALCAVHNFIRTHNPNDELVESDLHDTMPDDHDSSHGIASVVPATTEVDYPSSRRDFIAQQMWDDYVRICNERGFHRGDSEQEAGSEGDDEDPEYDADVFDMYE
jgi:DDE superfamily endonuclease